MSNEKKEYPRQPDFIDEKTGKVQGWDTLANLGFEEIGHEILRWTDGANNSVFNTGYTAWHRVLGYAIENGPGYQAVVFQCHGDWGSKTGNSSFLHRIAKLIRFEGESKLRVRYMIVQRYLGDEELPIITELVDIDYPEHSFGYPTGRNKTVGCDIASHVSNGSFRFSDRRPSPFDNEEPEIDPRQRSMLVPTFRVVAAE